jgi:hypothetical protein
MYWKQMNCWKLPSSVNHRITDQIDFEISDIKRFLKDNPQLIRQLVIGLKISLGKYRVKG